jgi:Na+-transporting NADH:ubiquinone oxidoreductase subunit C
MKKDSLMYTVIFTFAITFIFVFILAVAHKVTAERVNKHKRISEAKAYLSAAGIEVESSENIQEKFYKIFGTEYPDKEVLIANINGEKIFISRFSGKGLWGTIYGVIATNNKINKIIGLEITSHSETPGLGGRIEEPWFLKQFKGEEVIDKIKVTMGVGQGDFIPENSMVDGITGATRTSESIENIINEKLIQLKDLKRRGKI